MHVVIKDRNDLAVDLDGIRDPDRLLPEEAGQRLGDRRLAGARRPVQEDRTPGYDRGPELRQRRLVEHEVPEGVDDIRVADVDVADALALHPLDVVVERTGTGPTY